MKSDIIKTMLHYVSKVQGVVPTASEGDEQRGQKRKAKRKEGRARKARKKNRQACTCLGRYVELPGGSVGVVCRADVVGWKVLPNAHTHTHTHTHKKKEEKKHATTQCHAHARTQTQAHKTHKTRT